MATKSNKKTASNEADVQFIPLNKLKKSPRNARKTPHPQADIAALAASIAAHGLLQSPVVEPEVNGSGKPTGFYLVTIGEGRRQAQLLRVKRKEIAKTEPIRCVVEVTQDAFEISLAENAIRSPMHPADQFEAFYALNTEKGLSAEDIAARFGVTPAVVRQRLKLAKVSPKLIEAYRNDEMTLDVLTAFALTDDYARQEDVWEHWGSVADRDDILAALTTTQVATDDRCALFVGLDAYQAAGGHVVRDLFDEDGGGYLTDCDLLERLVAEKLDDVAASVRAEGWKWVTVMPRYDHAALSNCRRVYPQRRDLTEDENAQLDALQADYDATDEEDKAAIERLEQEIAAVEGEDMFPADVIARAGVVICIGHDREPRIERGFIRSEDEMRTEKEGKARASTNGSAPLPEKLVAELTAHRTMALRNALAENPDTAFLAMLHALSVATFYRGNASSCLDLRISSAPLARLAPDIDDTAMARQIEARHETWAKVLPEKQESLWAYLDALGQADRMTLLAHCVSQGVDAVRQPQATRGALAHADQLAQAVGLDMAACWTPTPANYLGRVSKDRILEAVREGVSKEAAENLSKLKKQAMAEAAAQRLQGKGWLPPILRCA